MAEPLDQIGAPVPDRVLVRIRLERSAAGEQQIPAEHQRANVEGKRHLVGRGRPFDRRHAHEIGKQGVAVLARDGVKGRVGHRRIERRKRAVRAIGHELVEAGGVQISDAGSRIRCDVRRIDRAERRGQGPPAGEGFAALGGVAGRTVARRRQIFAGRDGRRVTRQRMIGTEGTPHSTAKSP